MTYLVNYDTRIIALNPTPIKVPYREDVKILLGDTKILCTDGLHYEFSFKEIWKKAKFYNNRLEDYNYFGLMWSNPIGAKRLVDKEKLQEIEESSTKSPFFNWLFQKVPIVSKLSKSNYPDDFTGAIRLGFNINPEKKPITEDIKDYYEFRYSAGIFRARVDNNQEVENLVNDFLVYYVLNHYTLDL